MRTRAFTLVEALVVVAVIGLILGILIPTLAGARMAAKTTACLSNIRQLETAHWLYMTDKDGRLVDVGLPHGGVGNLEASFVRTLAKYHEGQLNTRSPADRSPHWPEEAGGEGIPVPGTDPAAYRLTSYGINNFLVPGGYSAASTAAAVSGSFEPYERVDDIDHPARVVHFVTIAERGAFAASDHPHVETWVLAEGFEEFAPRAAAQHLEIDMHGGPETRWNGDYTAVEFASASARTNYGFLDGHAETLLFGDVFRSNSDNRFNPDPPPPSTP